MKKERNVFKSCLTMLRQGGTMHTDTKGTTASVLQSYVLPAAVFALVCLVSTADAFGGGSNWMEGATIKGVYVYTNQGDRGILLRTNEATGNGCNTFYIPYDHLGFNAALALLTTAKVANKPIFVEYGTQRAPWSPEACLLGTVGLP
jgi:hypothetical protein